KVRTTLKKILSFLLSQVINIGMQTLLLYVFVKWFQFPSEIASFAGLIITITITFIVSKWILKD
ncbi:GtrA family protein, partial [Staphylococcus haemolyticus]|uniref:GtrA family protein n=1 Tax=Staphylococcus haemolyticus TaxID=1283 RepID=UPI000D4ECBCA